MSANFTPEMEDYEKIKKGPLFIRFVLENFPLITDDFDAMTYYGALCKIVDYVKKLIDNETSLENNMTALYDAYNQLQDYVNHYFDNLDIQEEINNKLDEMAESGQLADIISMYLNYNVLNSADTVDDMKANTNLVVGSRVQTLGFYYINDGGDALYIITDDTELTIDNAFVIQLNNGLKAKLIHGNNIEVEKLGFKADSTFDCGEIFEYIMEHNNTIENTINLLFGNKTYYFDETLIYSNLKFNIYGKSNNIGNYERHTVFKPFRANQRFILKIGGTKDFAVPETWTTFWKTNYILEGITFSDDNYPLQVPVSPNNEKYGLLCIEYFSGLILDVSFTKAYSRCIYIKNCWEMHFKYLSMRACYYDVKSSGMYVDNVLQDNYSNTSAYFFDFIDLEGINGTFLRTGNNCNILNWLVNELSIENGNRAPEGTLGHQIALVEDKATYESCTPFGLFEFNSSISGLQINMLNIHNFGNKYYYIDNSNTKGIDCLFKFNKHYEVNVNSINFNACGGFTQVYGSGSIDGYIESTLTISNMIYSPRTIPQTSASTTGGDMLGYFYNNIPYGIVDINQTNMHVVVDGKELLKPKLYENLELKSIIGTNRFGWERYGKTDKSQSGIKTVFGTSRLSQNLEINYPCKIQIGIKPKALVDGEKVIGCYLYNDSAYYDRVVAGITSDDLNKDVVKTITITSSHLANANNLVFIITAVSSFDINYINVIPT